MTHSNSDNPRQAELAALYMHSRHWRKNLYVYPVIARRSRGLSVGINLSPSQACNFRCVYCQVQRTSPPGSARVDLPMLQRELGDMLDFILSGEIWRDPTFAEVPEPMRRFNDIAFSGDGEPTISRSFPKAVQIVTDAKRHLRLVGVKTVVISNATRFHTQTFRKAIPLLESNNGEVWAKLDAGTPAQYSRICRSSVPYKQVLNNIKWLACRMPIVIQSCFVQLAGKGPSETEQEMYIARLRSIVREGGRIKAVHLYTVARPPAESFVSAVPNDELDALAAGVRDALPAVPTDVFYGSHPA